MSAEYDDPFKGDKSTTVINVLAFLVCSFVLNWIWKNRKLYALSWKLPGPTSIPYFGNAIELGLLGDINQLCTNLMKMKRKYGDVFRVWLGTELTVVFSDPKDFECVLISKAASKKGPKYHFMSRYVGYGLMTSSGQYYTNHRHILNPSYNSDSLRNHVTAHNEHATWMIDKMLEEVCDKKVENVSVYPLRFAVGTLSQFLYGFKDNYQTGKYDHVITVGSQSIECFYSRICKPWLCKDFVYNMTAGGKRTDQLWQTHYNHYQVRFLRCYDEYVKNIKSEPKNLASVDDDDKEKRLRTPFHVMLDAHLAGKMSKQEILYECTTMYYPGVDSLYTLLSFFLMMMSIHKECQDNVWREIVDVMGEDLEGPVMPEHIPKFKYLDMCLKETNRLFPTGASLMRTADEDFTMAHRNLVIPVGTTILLSIFMLNRNPKYWNDPNAYVPERFSPENSAKRPNFSYVPFSAGIRNCIGKTFSLDAVIVAGVYLIRAMEFSSDLNMEDVRFKSDVSIRSSIGFPMSIKRRNAKM